VGGTVVIDLTPELVRKHLDRLVEATTNVAAHTRISKKGKVSQVASHPRDVKSMSDEKLMGIAKIGSRIPGLQKRAIAELKRRKKKKDKNRNPYADANVGQSGFND
jgi:hypothetical protein